MSSGTYFELFLTETCLNKNKKSQPLFEPGPKFPRFLVWKASLMKGMFLDKDQGIDIFGGKFVGGKFEYSFFYRKTTLI